MYVVMPDTPRLKRAATDEPLALQLLSGAAHVVRTAHHQHLLGEFGELALEVVGLCQNVVAVRPD